MQLPLQITFHNIRHNAQIESAIRSNAEWLDNYNGRIMSCRVVVDQPHKHHKDGNPYQIRIDLKVPGREIIVKRVPRRPGDAKDLDILIRDAFDEARRQLEDHAHRRRGDVKVHESSPHAHIIRISPEAGYGFLQTPDGREIYFHRNSVLGADFDDLQVGMEVRFVEELGEKGPQASTVTIVGRHGHH